MIEEYSKSIDPRGVIFQSYQIENLTIEEARSIFLEWVLTDLKMDQNEGCTQLWDLYGKMHPQHPMSTLISEGMEFDSNLKARRKGGRTRNRK